MPEYKYTAADIEGHIKSDLILADNEEEVRLQLKRQNLDVITIVSIPDAEETTFDKMFNKVSTQDKAVFLEYFASMLESGLTVSDALQAFYEDLDKPKLRKFVKDAQQNIRNGQELSKSFEAYEDLFPKMYAGMIKVGEASGTLDKSLRQLAEQLKKTNEIKGKVKNAMIYPTVIITAMVLMVTGLIVFVIPQIAGFFDEVGLELPFLTQLLVDLSSIMQNYWFIIIPGLVVGFIAFGRVRKTENFKRWWGKVSLRLPVIGPIFRAQNVALFARTFGSLLSSGVNILEALDVVADSLDNQLYVNITKGLKEDIAKGNTLSDSLQKYSQHFAPFELRVIAISERTGKIAEGMMSVAVFYEAKLFGLLEGLSAALEPLILIFMGGIVALIAMAIIVPIFQIVGNIETATGQ